MPTLIPSKAQVGRGTQAYIGSQTGLAANPEVYTALGEPINVKFSSQKRSVIKTTNLSSGEYDSKLGTQIDGGTCSMEFNRISNDPGQLALHAAMNTAGGPPFDFKIVLPVNAQAGQTTTGDVITFSAIITELDGFSLETDKAVTFNVVLEISGARSLVAGS